MVLKYEPGEVPHSGRSRRPTYEAVFIPFRPNPALRAGLDAVNYDLSIYKAVKHWRPFSMWLPCHLFACAAPVFTVQFIQFLESNRHPELMSYV